MPDNFICIAPFFRSQRPMSIQRLVVHFQQPQIFLFPMPEAYHNQIRRRDINIAVHDTVQKIRHVLADIYKKIIRILRQHPVDLRLFFIKLTALPVIPGRNLCNMFLQKIGKLRTNIQLRIRQNRHSNRRVQNMYNRLLYTNLFFNHPYSFYIQSSSGYLQIHSC